MSTVAEQGFAGSVFSLVVRALPRGFACALFAGTGALLGAGCGEAETVNDARAQDYCHELAIFTDDEVPPSPNGEELCPTGECNYQTQEGCPANRSCVPAATAAATGVEPRCIEFGDGATGDECDTSNDCQRGLACAGNVCRRLCCGLDREFCGDGETCFQLLLMRLQPGEEPVSTGAHLCYPTGCDVFRSDQCPSGNDCKIIDPAGTTACIPRSPAQLGEPCGAPDICGRGLTCVGPEGQKTCRRLCRHEECGDPGCRPGEGACVHFNRDPEGVGECTPGF